MEISKSRIAAYVGSGAAVGGLVGAARGPRAIAFGIATGAAAGAVHSMVENQTGPGLRAWGASIAGGAVAGALLLSGFAPSSMLKPLSQRAFGAGLGATAGLFAPVVAGVLLAQLGSGETE